MQENADSRTIEAIEAAFTRRYVLKKRAKYKAPEEFFRMLCAFFDDVEKSMPKPEVKRTFNSKTKGGKKIDQKAVMDNILSQLRLKNK